MDINDLVRKGYELGSTGELRNEFVRFLLHTPGTPESHEKLDRLIKKNRSRLALLEQIADWAHHQESWRYDYHFGLYSVGELEHSLSEYLVLQPSGWKVLCKAQLNGVDYSWDIEDFSQENSIHVENLERFKLEDFLVSFGRFCFKYRLDPPRLSYDGPLD